MSRRPAVADMFYPADRVQLIRQLERFIKPSDSPTKVIAAIAPHAGYMYSGAVAGEVFSRIYVPDTVVILGPNHRGVGSSVSVMALGSWEMPGGMVPVNEKLSRLILGATEKNGVAEDIHAHAVEHSVEVQIPFLQYIRPDVTIVPIIVSRLTFDRCSQIGVGLAHAVREYGRDVLIVASTDMTHYESHDTAREKDGLAIELILDLDDQGLYGTVFKQGISMCGMMPTTIALSACKALGATGAELIRYATSGEVSGDYGQVVGYAGMIVY